MASPLWLDKLRAVPIIGFRFTPLYVSNTSLLDLAQPIVNRWIEATHKPDIRFDSPTQLTLDVGNGYSFIAGSELLNGQFNYRAKVTTTPNQDPVVTTNPAEPYTDLVEKVSEQTLQLFDALYKKSPRRLRRVGIVANTAFSPDKVVPGVQSLIDHLGDPWVNGLENYNSMLSVVLQRRDTWHEKCHHTIRRDHVEDESSVDQVLLTLDWQRVYVEPEAVSLQKLRQIVAQCTTDAYKYFETFGMGDLKYE